MKNLKIEDLYYEFPGKPVDEENWNIETWRKEYPIDYFKVMYMLNQYEEGIAKAEAFEAVYRILRLYVPDVLYKYYSLSDDETLNVKKFQTLNDGLIYLSNISDFNDPFDAKGFFYDAGQLNDIEWLKPFDGKLIDDFTAYIRSTSLTENGVQSMPMWAHYGSNHRGFCVSYDMSANGRLSACTFPVQYTNERFDITSLMKKHAEYISSEFERQSALGNRTIELNDLTPIYATTLLCNLKHSSWSYEKEFRCTLSSQAKGIPYVEAKPKEIYIGMNCSPLHTKRLMEIADSWNIPIKKMSFDECSTEYKLVDNRI